MIFRFLWPGIVWSLVILFLSLIPGKELPEVDIFQVDKLVHFFFFSVLMILTCYGIYKTVYFKIMRLRPAMIGFAYSLSLGIVIEILQQYVPGRSFSYADMFANSVGVGIGYLVFVSLKRWKLI
jgi:VanZ family protein